MTIATATLSSVGHIIIPKTICDQLHWEAGHELIIETTDSGVLLKAKSTAKKLRLEDLRGFLQTDGPVLPIEELCQPVEYTDREESGQNDP